MLDVLKGNSAALESVEQQPISITQYEDLDGKVPSTPYIIELSSSDSESDAFLQPHPSSVRKVGNRQHESNGDDIIELTDSTSSNSSDLPDTLTPLVKKPRREGHIKPQRKQSPSDGFLPLYVYTSDEAESEEDAILVSNDLPGSQRAAQNVPLAKGPVLVGVGPNTVKGHPLFDSPKKNTAPAFPQVAQKSSSKRPAHKTKEQTQRQKYATELFAELNRDVFGNRLPTNTALEWSKRLLTTAGRARWHRSRDGVDNTKIELASKILDCDERIRNTLAHEMCHLACWVIDKHPREGHGQLFKSWANKVMKKHPHIHISTRHSYEISYPYEWKCEKCSKIYGRYSKSIKPDVCVCGVCKVGKLTPLFVETRQRTKVRHMDVTKTRDSPNLVVESPKKSDSSKWQTLPSSTNLNDDIPGLADTLQRLFINDQKNLSSTF